MKFKHISGIFLTAVLLAACGEKPRDEAPVSAIKQGQTVRFAGGFGCVTKASFHKLLQQSAAPANAAASLASIPPDCVALPHETNFRVLSVEEQSGQVAIEVTNSHNLGNSGGLWTDPKFVAS